MEPSQDTGSTVFDPVEKQDLLAQVPESDPDHADNLESSSRPIIVLDSRNNASQVANAEKHWWQGNWSIYWIFGLLLSFWFLWIQGIIRTSNATKNRQPFGPFFGFHLVGAYFISIACIWNLFHPPSSGIHYKKLHVYIGRIAVPMSFLGVFAGLVTAWWERDVPFASAIGLTIAGVAQLIITIMGLYHIKMAQRSTNLEERKVLIDKHKNDMHRLFYLGCLAPALLRIIFYLIPPTALGGAGIAVGIIVGVIPLSFVAARAIKATDLGLKY